MFFDIADVKRFLVNTKIIKEKTDQSLPMVKVEVMKKKIVDPLFRPTV